VTSLRFASSSFAAALLISAICLRAPPSRNARYTALSRQPANRNYFESLKNQSLDNAQARCASVHFIVGLEGEIIQCIPTDEMACHTGAKFYKPKAVTAFDRDC
jgi:N-acetyl-anhydromuramyl-L-alanine amidase AmpD